MNEKYSRVHREYSMAMQVTVLKHMSCAGNFPKKKKNL